MIARPEIRTDVAEVATWYEERQPGLGADFIEEVIRVWDALAENPEPFSSQKHPVASR